MIAAIVPAAGLSRRMGRPKLLLELDGRSILAAVVGALRQGGADLVVAVVPPSTEPEGPALAEQAALAGAHVFAPEVRPAEMRESVEIGLAEAARLATSEPEMVLLAPADSPGITPALVQSLIALHRESSESILIPTFDGRRGHPVVLPWKTLLRIADFPADVGVNALVAAERKAGRVVELRLADPKPVDDLDTPEDWDRWQVRATKAESSETGCHSLTVRLFALARQRAGVSEVVVDLAEGATVASLKAAIGLLYPPLADLLPNVLIAVDSEYSSDESVIPRGAQIAIIPPVSGGSDLSCGNLR